MILKYTENTEGLKIAKKTLDQNKVPCFATIYIYGGIYIWHIYSGTIYIVCVCVCVWKNVVQKGDHNPSV